MKLKLSTYRTFSGTKQVVEIIRKKETQWLIYEDDKPKFFVDFFDLEKESNSMMNSLVLCGKRTIEEVLELINKRNNINLSIPVISKLGIKKRLKSEVIELSLESLPEKWLDYSL
ncbi:hypothetical protein [Polaribacter glomeratus]|uniref:Uncharacterized protein n=1 Tax=Polaribacter glomeratus TaxID=102 RepID=A0A2S7WGW0_9FLAO|nr:hypothetical protein [Polaribacter glomeratus]PQJ76850.1 hypothetical protein BTO16_13345 [Polaribacter glomeratus]TXD67306.1 hypothetical protein ESX12_01570 [Polaribacter glomeratus]